MNIFAFYQHMPPYSGAGALRGHSVVSGLISMCGDGFKEIVVVTSTPFASAIPGAEILVLDVPEVENAESLIKRVFGELRMGWAASKLILSKKNCDMMLISTPAYLAALVLGFRARRRKIPYVIDLRDIYPQVYAEAGVLRRASFIYRFFSARSKAFYRGAQLVIAATKGLAREVSLESPGTEVTYVYNGFPASLMNRHPVKHDRFTVCFHGVLGFFQDVETLLRLAERLEAEGVDLVVIGYGRKEGLLRQVRFSNLRFLGRLSYDATISEVERCHVGLCLRRGDGISKDAFPVKVWEYLGLGMPSLVTPICEAGEFLELNGCGKQFDAGDVNGLVDFIKILKHDRETMDELTGKCHLKAKEFTREAAGVKIAGIIKGNFGIR